jgi:hypothetical protein
MDRRSLIGKVLCAGLALAAWGPSDAHAQAVSSSSYFIQHNFRIFPGGNLLPAVRGLWHDHAWVIEPGRAMFQVNPAAQPAGWNRFGMDWLIGPNLVVNQGAPFPVLANRGIVGIGPGGILRVDTAVVPPGPSQAFARSTISVNPYGPGGPVTGFVRSDGFATAVALVPGLVSRAWSFSMASVEVRGRFGFFGFIFWGPVIRDTVGGSAAAQAFVPRQRRRDPIDFRFLGPDNQVLFEDNLLTIESEILSDGEMNWEDNALVIQAPDADFIIRTNQRWVQNHGTVNLKVRDGVVVESDDEGFFEGRLPPLGTHVPLTIPLESEFPIQYALPSQFGDDIEFDLGGGSNLNVAEPDCPADFNGDNVVDFFDYLDFAAAFDAGDPSADFNHDDQVDFFDYLDFTAAFDAGCE